MKSSSADLMRHVNGRLKSGKQKGWDWIDCIIGKTENSGIHFKSVTKEG